jgi:monoamine oxidase
MRFDRRLSRRELLRLGALTGAGALAAAIVPEAALAARPRPTPAPRSDGRVVIVGAGLAGLRCAQQLWTKHGIPAAIFEGSGRMGGRCWSNRGFFSNGFVSEHGGQFLSVGHSSILGLARELGLTLEIVDGSNLPNPGTDVYWMDGAYYSYKEANQDWYHAWPAFQRALTAAGYPTKWNSFTAAGRSLDRMTVPEWIDAEVPGGTAGRFGRLLLSDTLSEFGGDPADQSALNIVFTLAFNSRQSLNPLAGNFERYQVAGGNDQLASGLAAQLPEGSINTGFQLVAVRRSGSSYVATFDHSQTTVDVRADLLVLALPFSTLRDCDLTHAGLSARKLTAIRELGMGTNAKVHLEFRRRVWHDLGYSGTTYSAPGGFETAWEESMGDRLPRGVLVQFPGGRVGASYTGTAFGPAPSTDVSRFLGQIEPLFPGASQAFDGVAYRDVWHLDRWHRGAYSYWRPGQYTTIAGYEGVAECGVHFAGEHTDYDFQGFMNGAVQSGERVANEVAGAMRSATKGGVAP